MDTSRPKYQRRHYEDLAALVRALPERPTKAYVAAELAVLFAQDNPQFQLRRFYDAAGVTQDQPSQHNHADHTWGHEPSEDES